MLASDPLLVLGLGSNLGDRERHLHEALAALEGRLGPLRVAPLYQTRAISSIAQPDFFNTIAVATHPVGGPSVARALLEVFKTLEQTAGRRQGPRDGPRPLDIDLLLFGGQSFELPADPSGAGALTVPHPRLHLRRFVLAPLCDLLPDLQIPGQTDPAHRLLAALGDDQAIERIPWSEPPPGF